MDKLHTELDRLLQDAAAAGHAVPPPDAIALRTAIAELVADIVEHACVQLMGASVSLDLARYADRFEVNLEDPGAPLASGPTPDALVHRHIGLSIVRASVDVLDYSRVGSRNHWRLVRQFHDRPL